MVSRPRDEDGTMGHHLPTCCGVWRVLSRGQSLVTWGSVGSCNLCSDLCGTPLRLSIRLGQGYGRGGLAASPQGSTPLSGLRLGARAAQGSSPGPEEGRWGTRKGRKQGGAGGGTPCLPSSTNSAFPLLLTEPRPPNPPSWFILKAKLADPGSIQGPLFIHPVASSFLPLLPSGESSTLGFPSLLCHGHLAPFLSPTSWVTSLKRGTFGDQGAGQVWWGPPPAHTLSLGAWGHQEDVTSAVPSTLTPHGLQAFRGADATLLKLLLHSSVCREICSQHHQNLR